MSDQSAYRRAVPGAALLSAGAGIVPAFASATGTSDPGLVTTRSTHDVPGTIASFCDAVVGAGWVVFAEIDHAAAAAAVGLKLAPRTVVLFGNPRTGTPVMAAHPTLALDVPMRVLVWQDDGGAVFVTRSAGDDVAVRVFTRHGVGVTPEGIKAMDALFGKLVSAATA
ncbi:MAG: DUF302 domain-containing protein [Proteobacteria bacterium]|nr:DUF302 domain-containing protein [Pseudomonadota bacterium]